MIRKLRDAEIGERKLRKDSVAARYDIETRTVDRWLRNPALNFPKPFYIGPYPMWHEHELEDWERSRARELAKPP